MEEKRVVITGIGAVTPIGNTASETWEGIKNKKCGIDKITAFDCSDYKTSMAGEVKNFEPSDYFDIKETRRLDRSSQFAIVAAREAFKDSGINSDNTNFENIGILISSGIGGIKTFQSQVENYVNKGHNRISPMFIPMVITNMPSGNVAIDLGLKGESLSIVTACASSTHSIGEAYRLIKHGYEEAVVAGGTEASICETGIAGFENMKALSKSTDKNRASIPFDKQRDGFVMGEGAGVIVLEELEHAQARGAKIYAELIGYGATSDSYHITSPAPDGEGATRAMNRAIKDAKISLEDIDYINAHGTSTHLNDACETMAIKNVLGEKSNNIMVSSTKGNTGHLLGAAGAVEALICAKAIEEGIVPPTINYKEKDEECDLDIVPNEIRKKDLNIVMSNSLGFGGHNASVIIKKYER